MTQCISVEADHRYIWVPDHGQPCKLHLKPPIKELFKRSVKALQRLKHDLSQIYTIVTYFKATTKYLGSSPSKFLVKTLYSWNNGALKFKAILTSAAIFTFK